MFNKRNLVPQVSPTSEEIRAAFKVLSNFKMHVYQLLYKHDLTTPGCETGHPFALFFGRGNNEFLPFFTVQYNVHKYKDGKHVREFPELHFTVGADWFDTEEKAAESDAKILALCERIREVARSDAKKPDSLACCALAESTPCVCRYSCNCILHGRKCVGTHD